jgi:hypothetical protein
MVAEYLDKNYDRVSHTSYATPNKVTNSYSLSGAVLLIIHHTHSLQQLRDETSVPETPGRDSAGPRKLQRHDEIYS